MIRRECYTPMTKHGGAIKGPGREAAAGACYGMSRRGSAVPAPILESPLPARRGHRRASFGRDRGSDSGDASGVQTGPQELKHSTEVSDCCGRTIGHGRTRCMCVGERERDFAVVADKGRKQGTRTHMATAEQSTVSSKCCRALAACQAGMLSRLALRLSPVRLSLFYASVLSLRKLVLEEMDDRLREIRPFYPPIGGFGGIGRRGGEGEQWVEIVQFHDDFPAQCSSIERTRCISTRHGAGKSPIHRLGPSLPAFVPLFFAVSGVALAHGQSAIPHAGMADEADESGSVQNSNCSPR